MAGDVRHTMYHTEVLMYNVCVDPGQKDVINKNAFEKFRKEHSAVPVTVDNAAPSERFEGKT